MHDILLKNNEYYGIRSIVNDYVFVIESSMFQCMCCMYGTVCTWPSSVSFNSFVQ